MALRHLVPRWEYLPLEPLSHIETEHCTAPPLPGNSKGISYPPALCLVMGKRLSRQGPHRPTQRAWAETFNCACRLHLIMCLWKLQPGGAGLDQSWRRPVLTAGMEFFRNSFHSGSCVWPPVGRCLSAFSPWGRPDLAVPVWFLFPFFQGRVSSAQHREAIALGVFYPTAFCSPLLECCHRSTTDMSWNTAGTLPFLMGLPHWSGPCGFQGHMPAALYSPQKRRWWHLEILWVGHLHYDYSLIFNSQ